MTGSAVPQLPSYVLDAASATATARSEAGANQDRVAVVHEPLHCFAVVCDGVGEFSESGAVAERAVVELRTAVRRGTPGGDLAAAIREVNDKLQDAARGATTVVAVSASPEGVVSYAYCGNGALLEIGGVPLGNGRTRLVSVNHLLPHVSLLRGRETLMSFIPFPSGVPVVSSGNLRVPFGQSRLFLACSDGICSEEDRREGEVDGTVWREVAGPLAALLDGLTDRWTSLCDGPGEPVPLLGCVLQEVLDQLAAAGRLDDDASVAAVFVRPSAEAAAEQSGVWRRHPTEGVVAVSTAEPTQPSTAASARSMPVSIVVRPEKRWLGRRLK